MKTKSRKKKINKAHLKKLIEEATVDAYSLDEAIWSWEAPLESDLGFPFKAKVVGEDVGVVGIDYDEAHTIVAVCKRRGKRYEIALLSIEVEPSEIEGGDGLKLTDTGSRVSEFL
jgi:hypothetical protein